MQGALWAVGPEPSSTVILAHILLKAPAFNIEIQIRNIIFTFCG
jgi:hypothetical protein